MPRKSVSMSISAWGLVDWITKDFIIITRITMSGEGALICPINHNSTRRLWILYWWPGAKSLQPLWFWWNGFAPVGSVRLCISSCDCSNHVSEVWGRYRVFLFDHQLKPKLWEKCRVDRRRPCRRRQWLSWKRRKKKERCAVRPGVTPLWSLSLTSRPGWSGPPLFLFLLSPSSQAVSCLHPSVLLLCHSQHLLLLSFSEIQTSCLAVLWCWLRFVSRLGRCCCTRTIKEHHYVLNLFPLWLHNLTGICAKKSH